MTFLSLLCSSDVKITFFPKPHIKDYLVNETIFNSAIIVLALLDISRTVSPSINNSNEVTFPYHFSRWSKWARGNILFHLSSTFLTLLWILCIQIFRWSEVKVSQSCPTLCNPMDCTVHGILQARILEWVAFHFSRESSWPRDWTQVSHCRWILYQLSHKGSPRILEWVAYAFSSRSSYSRNWTRVSCIAGRFFTNWAIRETLIKNV